MKTVITALVLSILTIATHLYFVFRPIEGVTVSELALGVQGPIEQYHYHQALRSLVSDLDLDALRYLINADCGGGAGCYDHGQTLVEVLFKVGDGRFGELAQKLPKQEAELLHSLLSAGYEYRGFSGFSGWSDFMAHFPLTFGNSERKRGTSGN